MISATIAGGLPGLKAKGLLLPACQGNMRQAPFPIPMIFFNLIFIGRVHSSQAGKLLPHG